MSCYNERNRTAQKIKSLATTLQSILLVLKDRVIREIIVPELSVLKLETDLSRFSVEWALLWMKPYTSVLETGQWIICWSSWRMTIKTVPTLMTGKKQKVLMYFSTRLAIEIEVFRMSANKTIQALKGQCETLWANHHENYRLLKNPEQSRKEHVLSKKLN